MSHLRLALDSGYSWWLCLALAALAAGAVIFFYRRAAGAADRYSLAAMIALRVALVLLVLAVLFRPALRYETGKTERQALLVCLDRSRSMSISDAPGLPARFDRARGALAGRSGALQELAADFDVRLWVFDGAPRKLAGEKDLRAETAGGEATNLSAALAGAAADLQGERLAGALLLTDGQDNSGQDPVPEIKKLGFPVYPAGAGTRLSENQDFRDIAVNSVETGRFAAVDNVCEVRAYLDAVGYRGRVEPVSLVVEDGQGEPEKARAELVLDGRKGDQEVVLRFTPSKAGSFKARVVAKLDPDERIAENNVQEFLLNVTEPRIRVLYVEGRVRSEYGFLRRNWALDPTVEVTGFYRVRPGVFIEQAPGGATRAGAAGKFFPESYDEARRFNVFVLGDLERGSLSDAQLGALGKAVSEGAGLLCLSGQASFGAGGWAGSALAELLPVDLAPSETRTATFPMQLTAAGRAHPVFTGCEDFFAAGDAGKLPKLEFINFVGAAKPGAEVLAVAPELKDPAGKPRTVLAVQRYGKGRSAVFTAGPTWKWELLRGQGRATPYAKFWGQLVRWLASEEVKRQSESAGVTAHIDKNLYGPGEKVRLWAEARGEGGRLAPNARVEAAVSGGAGGAGAAAGGKILLAPVAESAGQFETAWTPPGPGNYRLTVAAAEAGKALGEVTLEFRVGKPNLEFEKLDLDDRLLRRLADETRGRYFDLAGLDELVGALTGEVRASRTAREVRLYPETNLKGVLAALVFLAAAAAEWLIRKRLQLS
jgi:uncharacterized membrane protein